MSYAHSYQRQMVPVHPQQQPQVGQTQAQSQQHAQAQAVFSRIPPSVPYSYPSNINDVRQKTRIAVFATVAFFLIASPLVVKGVNDVVSYIRGSPMGTFNPEKGMTVTGLFFHTFFFFVAMLVILRIS